MVIDRIDHFVLTVADIVATCGLYRRTLGMEVLTFDDGRKALGFGGQKRALASLRSIYFRDPDGNLVEVANEA